jgi:hypothetical protein
MQRSTLQLAEAAQPGAEWLGIKLCAWLQLCLLVLDELCPCLHTPYPAVRFCVVVVWCGRCGAASGWCGWVWQT